jgi:hypothetical protein
MHSGLMIRSTLLIAMAVQASQPPDADLWQECQIESATLCGPGGCKNVEPTLKLYLGDYRADDGRRAGYYYRCRRGGECDIIENPWIGEGMGYRAFVMREQGVISRIGPDSRITDVATIEDTVLISRGRCWNADRPRIRRVVPPTHN